MISRNVIYNFVGFVAASLIMVFSYPLYIGFFSETEFGIFMLAIAIPSFVSLFGLGIFSSTTFYVSRNAAHENHGHRSEYIFVAYSFYAFLGTVCAVFVWLFQLPLAKMLNISDENLQVTATSFFYVGLSLPSILTIGVIVATLKGFEDFKRATIASIGHQIVIMFLPLVVGYFIKPFSVVVALKFYFLTNLVVAALATFYMLHKSYLIAPTSSFNIDIYARHLKALITYGVPTALAGGITLIIVQMPRLLTAAWFGPVEVGIFAIAFGVASKLQAASNSISEIVFPHVASSKDPKNTKIVVVKMFVATTFVSSILAAPLLLFPQEILKLWVGLNMAVDASQLLWLLTVAYLISSIASTNFHFLNGIGQPVKNLKIAVVQITIFVVAVIYFRMTHGNDTKLFGYVFIISHAAVLVLSLYYTFTSLKNNIFESELR